MIEVASLLIVLVMSLVITRVATVALTLTGMTRHTAHFQARSALTGAGFTTTESERVVSHPVRRRIILWLMLIGNTGLVLVASLMVVLFTGDDDAEPVLTTGQQIAILVAGAALLFIVARSKRVERIMSAGIERILSRYTDVGRRDYVGLLRISGGYQIAELEVEPDDWLAGRDLQHLALNREGVLVLGIDREDGTFLGTPRGDTEVHAGDTLLLYGRGQSLRDLDERKSGPSGHLRHGEAIAAQQQQQTGEEDQPDDEPAS